MKAKIKTYSKRQFLKASIFIVSAVLIFVAIYSIIPVFATVAPGSLEPGCSPTDPNCVVAAPLVTELSANTNIIMATNSLSFNTSALYIDPNNNHIGINTTSPSAVLDVNGNLILSGTGRYLNFGISTSSNGYGIRDNSGTLQFKNNSGSWIDMVTSTALTVNSVGSSELTTTTVTSGAYGTNSQALILTVDEDGRITNLSTSSISIAGAQIISGVVSSTFGGTNQDSSAWTGVAYINGGVWSASSTLNSGLLASNVMLAGEAISLLTNDSGFLTSYSETDPIWSSASGTLTVSHFLSPNISQWTNNAGYMTSYIETDPFWSIASTSLTVNNFAANTVSQWTNNSGYITSSSAEILTNKTWNGNAIGLGYGGTGTTTFANGGLVFSNGTILTQNNNLFWDNSDLKFGIGTVVPSTTIHIVSTTEQLRLGYNAGNYVSFTVSSTGQLDILTTGSAGIVKIGDAGNSSRSLTANDDLFVSGKLEVDGISYFDATSTFGGNLTTPANALVLMSASNTLRMAYSASAYTEWTIGSDGQLLIASGQPTTTFSNNLVADNLYSGILTMPMDGGQVDLADISVSSAATSGTPEGYNFLIDGYTAMSIYGLSDGAGSVNSTTIGLSIGTINTSSYRLYVKASNSASPGIGVDGYVRATGYITGTTTLDLAESYPIDCSADGECPQSFDVVCSVEKENNYVAEKCSDEYSDNAIGVVSEKPGFGLGDYDPMTYNPNSGITPSNYRMIALSGRVPVNVSNINGNIKAGDYLTSSKIPGVAVKAIEPGRVIGVALTSMNSPTGTVIIFVNPHWNAGDVNFVSNELLTEYGLLDQFTMAIKNSLRKLGIAIEKGIAKVKELRTEKLCVGETCVNESQLKQLLENNGFVGSAPSAIGDDSASQSNNKDETTQPANTVITESATKDNATNEESSESSSTSNIVSPEHGGKIVSTPSEETAQTGSSQPTEETFAESMPAEQEQTESSP